MNFDYTEEQKLLVQSLERSLAKSYDFEAYRSQLESQTTHSPDTWASLAELGIMAMPLPEGAGGFGGNQVDVGLITKELGRRLVPEPYVSNAVVSACIIEKTQGEAGNELLEMIGVGETQVATALYEPSERHNALAGNTTAEKTSDGFVLNGHKAVALGADSANSLIVSATLDGALSLFLVPADADGLTIRGCQLLDGRGAADVFLDGVAVASNALLASGAEAEAVIIEAVDRGAAALVADSVGAIEEVIAMTKDYLQTRTQFGRPIGSFQVLAHRMVDLMVDYEQAQSISMEASVEATNEDVTARQKAVSAAKAKVGAVSRKMGKESIQMHGGIGMTDEYALGAYVKRMLVNETLFGDTDHHLQRYIQL